ncbi:MAG TPA: flavodoxin domain-containing protein [Verrucomicrobiae bacterium]|nr:flavodoxin domain-containing protein [Verrucomicrobiae bacterium]
MSTVPFIPETAPFSTEQRAWLNGFLAGLHSSAPAGAAAAPAANAEPLLILFGSQTGSAEGLAKKVAKESQSRGFAPKLLPLNDYEAANLPTASKAVIISSTWGDGEPPDNAVNFWNWLNAETAPRLEKLQFAVLGLGDKNYSDFCGASKKFDDRLAALGAKRLAPRGECDADYEVAAKNWMEGLWEKLGGGSTNGAQTNGNHSSLFPLPGGEGQSEGKISPATPLYDKAHPFPARLLKNLLLNQPGSGKEVRHFEIALGGSGLNYEVGDALGVIPENCPELVAQVLAALKATGDEPVKVDDSILPLRDALTKKFDLAKPTQELLTAVAQSAPSPLGGERAGVRGESVVGQSNKVSASNEPSHPSPSIPLPSEGRGRSDAKPSELSSLLAPERAGDLKKWLRGRDVLDVLTLGQFTFTELLPLLRKLTPRLYSISSSPKAHPGEVHLTVGAVRYEAFGRTRKGVASTFLADLAEKAGSVKVFVQPSHGFKPPVNGDTPMIMVGPGTGIAPFRAFLEERAALGAKGKNWLFFGDQKRSADFLYKEQLVAWQKSGFLTRLDLAFSRDQADKIYVQDRMMENAAELWSWLEAGAHFYVCGDASRMAKDVDAALHKIIETAGGKNADEAKAYVARLKSDKRYQRDVY